MMKKHTLRLSKNKKRNWRKLEKGIEDDVHLSEKVQKIRDDEVGFSVDRKSDLHLIKTPQKGCLTSVSKGKTVLKYLRCFENQAYEIESDMVPKRNVRAVDKKILKRERKAALWRELQRNKVAGLSNSDNKQTIPDSSGKTASHACFDIWGKTETNTGFVPLNELLLKGCLTRPRGVGVRSRRKIASVELPHAGQSYNPAITDYVSLLKQEETIELDKLKQEARLNKQVDGCLLSASAYKQMEDDNLEQLGACVFETNDDNTLEIVDTVLPQGDITKKKLKKTNKKTIANINRAKRSKQRLTKEMLARVGKRMLNDLENIKRIEAEVKREEKRRAVANAAKKQMKDDRPVVTAKLGRTLYTAPEGVLQLSDELATSYRDFKSTGNFFQLRLNQLEKTEKIAPIGTPIFHAKKMKKYVKKSAR